VVKNRLLTFLLGLSVLLGCSEKREDGRTGDMTFKINSALLGERYVEDDLGVSFAPPKNCLPVAPEILEQAITGLRQQIGVDDTMFVRPRQIFLNQEEGFLCAISRLPVLQDNDSSLAVYRENISEKAAEMEVRQDNYPYRGLEIHQMRMESEQTITFKLIVPQTAGNSFQLDYVIPKSVYIKNLEAIE